MPIPSQQAPTPWFDLADPTFKRDPFPFWARSRTEMPIFRLNTGRRGESFYVTRYDDVMTVMTDVDRFANDKRNAGHQLSWAEKTFAGGMMDAMVMQDGKDHRRLRTLVTKAFSPRRVGELEARIQQIVDGLLDRMPMNTEVDLIDALALPVPLTVISEMMGVREQDRPKFHRWMNGVLDLDSAAGVLPSLLTNVPKLMQLNRLLKRLIDERRKTKTDDLLSDLVAAEEAGDKLSFAELIASAFIILLAGHETTVNLIGNGVLALLEHPEELKRLRADPSLIDSTVEEMMRFTSPVQINAPRYVREDTELRGVLLPRGTSVSPVLGSANRDELRFPDPDKLDIGRDQNRHVGFGYGIHFCIGAPLARLEAKACFQALLKRFSSIELTVPPSALTWRQSNAIRGVTKLPIRVS